MGMLLRCFEYGFKKIFFLAFCLRVIMSFSIEDTSLSTIHAVSVVTHLYLENKKC